MCPSRLTMRLVSIVSHTWWQMFGSITSHLAEVSGGVKSATDLYVRPTERRCLTEKTHSLPRFSCQVNLAGRGGEGVLISGSLVSTNTGSHQHRFIKGNSSSAVRAVHHASFELLRRRMWNTVKHRQDQGWNCRGGWTPQFMSTDTHFWVKIGFKFQSLGKISNISASDPFSSFRSIPTFG